jgi:hypothetical protein
MLENKKLCLVRRLPTKRSPLAGSGASLQVEFVPVTSAIAVDWNSNVQPLIRQLHANGNRRADHKWNWHWIYLLGRTFGWTLLALRLVSRPGRPSILGLIATVDDKPWPIDAQLNSNYVEFLCAAPDQHLELCADGGAQPTAVGTALVDSALVRAWLDGRAGRVWLHAAQAGGDELVRWYHGRGFKRIPEETSIPHPHTALPLGARNDGRFMYQDELLSTMTISTLESFRSD